MGFFDRIKQKLFGASEMSSKNPLIHEMLERGESEKKRYVEWKASPERKAILNYIQNQYELSKDGNEDQSMIRLLASNPSHGFMLRYPSNFEPEHFQHLFDHLQERVCELGYKSYMSDRKIFTRDDHAETLERHYLKPGKDMSQYGKIKLDQHYGNIHIELTKINDLPTHLKVLCNCYSDGAFKEARDFDEFIQLLCEPEKEQ